MNYEVIGYDGCKKSYELKVQGVTYTWDEKTAIIHVELPKIKERKEKDNDEKI